MHKLAFAAALAAFAGVALLDVRLGIRGNLRAYQIAALKGRQLELRESQATLEQRVARLCAPEWVFAWAESLRRERSAPRPGRGREGLVEL